MGYRIGLGEDIHRLEVGRPLILAGVKVPFEKGLLGHSDADVVFHALSDALLSSIGERDIGYYFSPSNPDIADIDSRKILEFAFKKTKDKGYFVSNVSVVITCERPKLSPYIDSFKESIDQTLRIGIENIGITCKTNEGLGPLGENRAIACHANVILEE